MAPNNALQKSNLGNEDDNGDASLRERDGMISSAEVRARGDGVNKLGGQSSELKRFLVSVMFLTRLPCPRWVDHSPADLVPGMTFFPLIGSFVGLFASVWFEAFETVFPPLVAASGSTLMGVWLTGCFHEDGLADTMDSFGGGWGRAQILRIMKDSRCGTYAIVGVCLCLFTKCSLLVAFAEDKSAVSPCVALIVAHTVSRLSALWLCKLFPYVFDEGDDKGLLYNSFAGCLKAGLLTWTRVVVGTLYTFGLCLAVLGPNVSALLALLFGVFVTCSGRYAVGVIGGVIGDYLGASIMLLELVVYMTLTAHVPNDVFSLSFLFPWFKLLVVCGIPAAFMSGAGELPEYDQDKEC